ncbi:hypothetical protein HDU92_002019 [Lobulomyces angularis]|nr:hypothetical protein HDU92_002019 [Lobulomyces angularis]
MSVVYYKFKAEKSFSTVTFDGMGISVFDVKRDIMTGKKLGKGTDMDLHIYNSQSNDEYKDDLAVIPRNTQILVKRSPPQGKVGTAQRYLTGSVPTNSGFSSRVQSAASSVVKPKPPSAVPVSSGNEGLSEEDEMKKFQMQSEAQWLIEKDNMKAQKPIYRPYQGGNNFRPKLQSGQLNTKSLQHVEESNHYNNPTYNQTSSFTSSQPPRPGYICYRCRKPGHYLKDCPTHGDPNFEGPIKPVTRTTGIPRIFLKKVDPVESGSGSVMVSQNGDLVVAKPDDLAWNQISGSQKLHQVNLNTAPKEFKCFICEQLMSKPSSLEECCEKRFCEECIRQSLIENVNFDLRQKCPYCLKEKNVSEIKLDKNLNEKILNFLNDIKNKTKKEEEELRKNKELEQQQQTQANNDVKKENILKTTTSGSGLTTTTFPIPASAIVTNSTKSSGPFTANVAMRPSVNIIKPPPTSLHTINNQLLYQQHQQQILMQQQLQQQQMMWGGMLPNQQMMMMNQGFRTNFGAFPIQRPLMQQNNFTHNNGGFASHSKKRVREDDGGSIIDLSRKRK